MAISLYEKQHADLNALRALVDQWKRKRKASDRVLLITVGILGPMLLVSLPFLGQALAWVLLALGLCVGVYALSDHIESFAISVKNPSDLLDRINDIRTVGLLCEAQEAAPDPHADLVIKVLCRLLPKLEAEQEALLSRSQRICLYRKLDYATLEHRPEFVATIILMLERIGDIAAVPHVQRVLTYQAYSPKQRLAHRAAEQYLAMLKPLYDDKVAGQTLLRGAAAPAEPPDTLLRAASEAPSAPSEQLLRATYTDDDDS